MKKPASPEPRKSPHPLPPAELQRATGGARFYRPDAGGSGAEEQF